MPFQDCIFESNAKLEILMKATEQQTAAKKFVKEWSGKGYEKGECQKFWIDLLCNVFGIQDFADFIFFEEQVKEYFVSKETKQSKSITNFIDACIPSTHVIIEQKSSSKDLRELIKQSNGSFLTPFQQAKNYSANLPYSKRPRWIVTCNFDEFLIYDMERPDGEPQQIFLKDLPKELYRLQFLVDSKSEHIRREEEISLKAGELVGKLYDALYKEYINPDEKSLRSLNILCVRIVFCLYAEDAGLFDTKTAFEDYIQSFKIENVRRGLIDLFKALDTKPENRDKYDTKLNPFPYVNGGLFAYEDIEIPNFSQEIIDVIVNHCAPFDWSEISPTIFGAVFESTLNPETRRKGGMHYTSIENIHKVIDPLFLDDLREEFDGIAPSTAKALTKPQRQKLLDLQDKLSSLKFLDPACGSGNFLTETYTSLRKLENQILKLLMADKIVMGEIVDPVKVSITQFYGIEINDFAVNVAKTALWIAESQMLRETETIVQQDFDFLPLTSNATIIEGNALRMDWTRLNSGDSQSETLVADKLNIIQVDDIDSLTVNDIRRPYKQKKNEITVITREVEYKDSKDFDYGSITSMAKRSVCNYDFIMGNPPFIGYSFQSKEQKEDLRQISKDIANNIDYVAGWYFKAAQIIKGSNTKVAFVSTNSISQGEQVAVLWQSLFEQSNIAIDFAWRTFRWDSESEQKAHVHCVIVGFSDKDSIRKPKHIFNEKGLPQNATNINGYLLDAPTIFVEKQSKPFSEVPPMFRGSSPVDDGNFILTDEEKSEYIKKEPQGKKFLRKYMMGKDFIDRKPRWCFWLLGANPAELRDCPILKKRIEKVREFRLNSTKAATVQSSQFPTLFGEIRPCESEYIAIPRISSESRKYIPIEYLEPSIIAGDTLLLVPNAQLFHFGVLTSNIHNAWMRTVCGRLKSDYRYSNTLVYNNFPWSNPSDAQKAKIEATAQAILDVRAKYPDASLADLYDNLTMPVDLRKAHIENDHAVMESYGFDSKMTEDEIVAELFKMYEERAK